MFSVDYATLEQIIRQFMYTGLFRAHVVKSRLLPEDGYIELQAKEGVVVACQFVAKQGKIYVWERWHVDLEKIGILNWEKIAENVPPTTAFQLYLQAHARPMFGLPITTQVFIALISYIVITSLQESLVRADKAEEVTKLQQVMAEQTRRELQTKRQLESDITEIVRGLTRFSNGDNQARIRLEQGNPLWSIAATINNMMSRFIRLREQEGPREQTALAVRAYIRELQMARISGHPLPELRSRTEVDTLVKELLKYAAQPAQQTPRYTQP